MHGLVASTKMVDYMVAYELCHLHHHNHSPGFWRSVERVFPDYAEYKEWLKVNGRLLEV